jgi:hypothetical protein
MNTDPTADGRAHEFATREEFLTAEQAINAALRQQTAVAEEVMREHMANMKPLPAFTADDLDGFSDMATLKDIAGKGGTGRDAAGRFVHGNGVGLPTQFGVDNTAALKHGLFSRRAVLPGPAALGEGIERLRETLINELGGPEKVGVLKSQAIDCWLRLGTLAEGCWTVIERHGAVTPKGRQRSAVGLLLAIYGRMEKVAQEIRGDRRVRRRLGAERHAALSKAFKALSGLSGGAKAHCAGGPPEVAR